MDNLVPSRPDVYSTTYIQLFYHFELDIGRPRCPKINVRVPGSQILAPPSRSIDFPPYTPATAKRGWYRLVESILGFKTAVHIHIHISRPLVVDLHRATLTIRPPLDIYSLTHRTHLPSQNASKLRVPSTMPPQRPTYTREQITQYFDRIQLPQQDRKYDVSALEPADALTYLTTLQKYQLAAVPFENLTLHYSAHRHVSLHPEELFKKMVTDNNGRGGYCMENNSLFGIVLLSLGFTVYAAGGHVCQGDFWLGLSHMVNLVTIGNRKYQVDVGVGPYGPIEPLPLERPGGGIYRHISPASVRLQWRSLSANSDPEQRYWVYEIRNDEQSEWGAFKYAFTEMEFFPQDFAIMNAFPSTSPRAWFTKVVVASKAILDERGELAGRVNINGNSLKIRMGAHVTEKLHFETEQDRLDALEKYFGIRFGAAERDGIRQLVSEIV